MISHLHYNYRVLNMLESHYKKSSIPSLACGDAGFAIVWYCLGRDQSSRTTTSGSTQHILGLLVN